MRFQIVGITLDNVLRFEHSIADTSGLDVELGESGSQKFGRRVGFDGEAVFFYRFIGQLTTAINRDLFFVHVR